MDLKGIRKIKFNIKEFTFKKIKDGFLDFLLSKFGAIFMVVFLGVSLAGGIIIYRYIFSPDWSDARKEEYRNKLRSNKTVFDESKFENIISKIRERNNSQIGEIKVPRDIFK